MRTILAWYSRPVEGLEAAIAGLLETGDLASVAAAMMRGYGPEILAYLNRLSDVIWLFGRLIEVNAGVDARLRTGETVGPKWSKAWK